MDSNQSSHRPSMDRVSLKYKETFTVYLGLEEKTETEARCQLKSIHGDMVSELPWISHNTRL